MTDHYMEVEATSNLSLNGRPLGIINESDIPTSQLGNDPAMREIANHISRWVDNARSAGGRSTMFDRGSYTPPDNPYDEMRSAKHALRYDSVVAGVHEITESFAFDGVKWESQDTDVADVFNQMSRDQNLDDIVRQMWREEYLYGQFVCAKLWGWKEYTVRGKTAKGNKRKKTFKLWVPLRLNILDSQKVVPAGVGPLGGETLCWQATKGEIGHYQAAYSGDVIDPLMVQMFKGTYIPNQDEDVELSQIGVNTTKLLAMNPDWVFRHTLTRPAYERFAEIRMKSVFPLLDLKRQLMNSDRAALIGAANYILLIRKGDEKSPAQPEEIQNLRENYNFIAKMPVIISDHRLSIDIIAPKTDTTLDGDKYSVLDARILARLLGTLTLGGSGQRNETQQTLAAVVARVMENRRHMLKRTLEKEIARAVFEHPKNKEVLRDLDEPNMVYTPRNINLGMDSAYTQALMALRTQREISRETILEFFGLDQSAEAQRMEIEEEFFDDIFKTQVPFAAAGPGAQSGAPQPNGEKTGPNGTPEAPGVSGARGGRPKGGGSPSANATKPAAKTAGGNSPAPRSK